MKEPHEWDENYILNNLPKGENDRFEFKGRQEIDLTMPGITDINRKGLAKELSAFANSGGGYLILGLNNKSRQVDDGGISTTVKSNGTKDYLEDVLPQLTDPPLQKMNIHEIVGLPGSLNLLPNRAIYVVEVGDSPLAPHQSYTEHVYYGRVASHSQPLSHRMVLDIQNRKQYPNLEIGFYYAYVDDAKPNLLIRPGRHNILLIQIKNNGPVYAEFVNSIILIRDYLVEPGSIQTSQNMSPIKLEDGNKYLRFIKENVIQETLLPEGIVSGREPGRYVPILPGRKHQWIIPLAEDFRNKQIYFKNDLPKLYWKLYADNAPYKNGEVSMRHIKVMPENVMLD